MKERIKVLCSEVQRLRTRLAQQGGKEELLDFIFRDSDIKLDYVQDLQSRLKYVCLSFVRDLVG